VTFAVADLTQPWPCEDQSIDLISCNLVLEHISDLSFIFAEGLRVLRDGGRFFVSELHPFRQYQGTQATSDETRKRLRSRRSCITSQNSSTPARRTNWHFSR